MSLSIYKVSRSPNWYYTLSQDGAVHQASTGLSRDKYSHAEAVRITLKHLGLEDAPQAPAYRSVSWMRQYIMDYHTRLGAPKGTLKKINTAFDWLIAVAGADANIAEMKRSIVSELKVYGAEKDIVKRKDGTPYRTGVSASTINTNLAYLSAAFNQLVNDELVERSPFTGYTKMKERKKKSESGEEEYLTLKQAKTFLEYLSTWEHAFAPRLLRIVLYTGCRRGEVLLLERGDIEFYGDDLGPGSSVGRLHIVNIKSSDKHKDWIPIHPEIRDDLLFFLNRFQESATPFAVCHPDTLSDWAKHAVRAIGLPESHCHTLRHTFATLARQSGMDMRDIQNLLRHSDLATTTRFYTHDIADVRRAPNLGI